MPRPADPLRIRKPVDRIAACNHHSMRGWALEKVYAADGTAYQRCRRCGGVFYDRWPLEEALKGVA